MNGSPSPQRHPQFIRLSSILLALLLSHCASNYEHQKPEPSHNYEQPKNPQLAQADVDWNPLNTSQWHKTGRSLQTAWRSVIYGTLRYPLRSTAVGINLHLERFLELFRGNRIDIPPAAARNQPPAPGTEAFEAYLDQQNMPPRSQGEVDFLIGGEEFHQQLEHDLAQAQDSVDVQLYIWDNDPVGRQTAEQLIALSEHMPVRILLDDLASHKAAEILPLNMLDAEQSHRFFDTFEDAGDDLQIRFSPNPFLSLDHSKMWIIDQQIAYLGGMNIGYEYRHQWHDLMARISGPVVAQIDQRYQRNWTSLGTFGWLSQDSQRPQPSTTQNDSQNDDQIDIRILEIDLMRHNHEAEAALLAAIYAARERVWLQNPYFASDRIMRACLQALENGVDLRLIIPEHSNHKVMDEANWVAANRLLQAGATIYSLEQMTHVKAYLCDNWLLSGSTNLDTLSLRLNREINFAINDPQTIADVETRLFQHDFERATQVTAAQAQARADQALLAETLADQL